VVSNSIHGSTAQNRWCSTRKVSEIAFVLMIAAYSDFNWPWGHSHSKSYLLIFPCICRSPDASCVSIWRHGGTGLWVGLEVRLRSFEFDWIPPCCVCFLVSPAHSWCPTCPPWSTPWFLITIKSLCSNLFSRSLVNKHKNEFTWWFSQCACDLVIGPWTSMEGVVVSNIVMSSSSSPSWIEVIIDGIFFSQVRS
jgi:hypothetical protein